VTKKKKKVWWARKNKEMHPTKRIYMVGVDSIEATVQWREREREWNWMVFFSCHHSNMDFFGCFFVLQTNIMRDKELHPILLAVILVCQIKSKTVM
jgi:hypothetical protein